MEELDCCLSVAMGARSLDISCLQPCIIIIINRNVQVLEDADLKLVCSRGAGNHAMYQTSLISQQSVHHIKET